MNDAIGAAAQGHCHDQGVLEGSGSEQVARFDVAFHAGLDGLGGFHAFAHFGWGCCRGGGGAREGETHRFNGGGHGIGGVHAPAGAGAGAGVLFDVVHDLVLCGGGVAAVGGGLFEGVVDVGSRGFVAGGDVDGFSEELAVANCNGAAVDHEGWAVVASDGHDASGHVFVTARDGDASVVVLGTGNCLDAVGYDLASLQGEAHA